MKFIFVLSGLFGIIGVILMLTSTLRKDKPRDFFNNNALRTLGAVLLGVSAGYGGCGFIQLTRTSYE